MTTPNDHSLQACPNCDDRGYTDQHYPVRDRYDRYGREVLTVGVLRQMLAGVGDEVQVVIASPDWYDNIKEVIVPSGDDPAFSAVTLFPGVEIDSRQF